MVVEQKIEIKAEERKGALDSMARARGMFDDKPEERSGIASASEQGYERVRRMQRDRAFNGTTGEDVTDVETEPE